MGLVCVCVRWGGGGGGGGGGGNQDVITIKTSTITRYPLQYLVSVSVLADGGGAVVTNAFHSYNT